jgi:membrane protease YdiL (CAAX protease family)
MDDDASISACPACGTPASLVARYCAKCGGALAGAPPAYAPLSIGGLTPGAIQAARRFNTDWDDLKRIGWLFGLLLANSFVYAMFSRHQTTPWPDVVSSLAGAIMVLGFVLTDRQGIWSALALRRPSAADMLAYGGLALAFVVVMAAYMKVLRYLGVPFLSMSADFVRAKWPFWSAFVLISVMPAVFEELAFRGMVQSALQRVLGPREALLIQGALFSILHLNPLVFPSHFAMGVGFGYLRQRFGSLYPGMLLHASWNLLVLLREWP